MRLNPVADGDDDIKVVVSNVAFYLPLALELNYPVIPESWFGGKFALLVNVVNVFADGAHVLLEQIGHLFLGKPDGFTLKLHFQTGFAVFRLIKQYGVVLLSVMVRHRVNLPDTR